MSENKRRIVSLFAGILLCTALIQTACAAWNPTNWNSNTGNATAWSPADWNANTGAVTTWNPADWNANTGTVTTRNANTEDKNIKSKVWGSADDSFSPSDFMSGLISQNGIQLPKTQNN